MPSNKRFQLLEINVISAQDLAPVTKTMRTYAVGWVHPERKLTTQIDEEGRTNPTWNDKFVFRVDEEFLNEDTSAVMIEIYAATWLRDVRIGIVRVLIGNLIPPWSRITGGTMRFVALQIRRPSGRPQGILNMGVSLLDGTMRSMPIYTELSSSAVGYRDLMDSKLQKQNQKEEEDDDDPKSDLNYHLRRSQSERSDPIKDNFGRKHTSICNAGSIITGSICNGSVITDSEVAAAPAKAPANGGNGSLVSDVGPSASIVAAAIAKGIYPIPGGGGSEVGSSILEDWTVEGESVEGLKTKIERWRTELPPIYDHMDQPKRIKPVRGHSRRHTDGGGGGGGGGKLFSCFGNAYGCEFTIVCGANSAAEQKKKAAAGGKIHVSPSDNSVNRKS